MRIFSGSRSSSTCGAGSSGAGTSSGCCELSIALTTSTFSSARGPPAGTAGPSEFSCQMMLSAGNTLRRTGSYTSELAPPPLIGYDDVNVAAERFDMREVGLLTIKYLVHFGLACEEPEPRRELRVRDHRSRALGYCANLALGDTVRLWVVRHTREDADSELLAVPLELPLDELLGVVAHDAADFPTGAELDRRLPLLEGRQSSRLPMQPLDGTDTTLVVAQHKPEAAAVVCRRLGRPEDIHVHHVEDALRSLASLGMRPPRCLASDARCAIVMVRKR
ncbi:hypothetical protein EXIGLDRAFT_358928 [Exidia glandulosa HHB12029]|uniref:Uncharacterized protein n=1 Tax=Exidia glandulosa HHB12029 TaxID=1314781 RepID=A0A165ZEM3_EXIGL|nr:hypothetical protein EXIGLDRAFT_358928 [Exidia glandulosa HHB12029]